MLDTNIWIDRAENRSPDVARLFELRAEGLVNLDKSAVVDTERTEGVVPELATSRVLETVGIIEVLDPAVPDHSRACHSVFLSVDDSQRIDRVFSLLFLTRDRHGSGVTERHSVRDAIQVATAIRYGYEAFVTSDPEVLRGATRIHEQEDWTLRILSPAGGVRWVERAKARAVELARRRQELRRF
jgi:predicted nucleic acid-binding protein